MISKEILNKLPEMARCMHFAMNKSEIQDSEWVTNFVKKYPTPELQQWDTVVPVLSACYFLKVWFKDHVPNHHLYTETFTDAELISATGRDFIKVGIEEKLIDLHKASDTIGDYDPFQGVIADTILALNWAKSLIEAMEQGYLINWHTLEATKEIEI